MMVAASKVVFGMTANIDPKELEDFASAVLKRVEGKRVKKGDTFKVSNKGLRVKATVPGGAVRIGDETELEILSRKMKFTSDIILAIDTSYSMRKNDYKPNRFGAAKTAVLSFLMEKVDTDDKLGVFTFGHRPSQVMELKPVANEDLTDVAKVLEDTELLGRTSIGNLIDKTLAVFDEKSTPGNMRMLIMLTDGADNIGSDPVACAESAKKKNVAIYPVLIGKDSHYDTELLRQIAQVTNGKFYFEPTEQELTKLYTDLGGGNFKMAELPQTVVENVPETKVSGILKKVKDKVW